MFLFISAVCIWGVLCLYLFMMDKRLSKIENKHQESK